MESMEWAPWSGEWGEMEWGVNNNSDKENEQI